VSAPRPFVLAALVGAVALAAVLRAVDLGAAKTERPSLLRFRAGEKWRVQDTVAAQVPDPQTGRPLTPTTRGVFDYRVEEVLPDGGAVVTASLVSAEAGTSLARMNPLPTAGKPEQALLIARDGVVYGLYGDPAERQGLRKAAGVDEWLEAAKAAKPWLFYKLPSGEIEVGQEAERWEGGEFWTIKRLADQTLRGKTCAVYGAKLTQGDVTVEERTWFHSGGGVPLKREVSERRTKNVSSSLTQVRL